MLRPAISLALVGTLLTAAITGLVAGWLLGFSTLEGLLLGVDPGGDRRRRDLRPAARLHAAAPARTHARGRVWPQRPGRDPARARVHRLDPEAGLRRRRHGGAVRARARGRAGGRARGRAGRGLDVQADQPRHARASIPVASIATAALAYGGAAVLHGSGFLAVYLAGLALGSAHIPAKRTITAFHEGLAWVGADRPLPHPRAARLPEPARRRAARGNARRAGDGRGRPARRDLRRHRVRAVQRTASGWSWAGRGFAGRCPWCWRPFR